MKKNQFEKVSHFLLGKGFYIVLILCVAAIGLSGYYLVRSINSSQQPTEPVAAHPNLVLPEQTPVPPAPPVPQEPVPSVPTETAAPQDDPQPIKEPVPEETPPVKKEVVYTWPVKGQILRGFSLETLAFDQTMGDWRTHSGIDIASELGIQVIAAGEGQVVEVYDDPMMGTTVVVQQPDDVLVTYSNLAPDVSVAIGDAVDTGSILGTVGGTALAESGLPAHLHLEMSLQETPLDPLTYLP